MPAGHPDNGKGFASFKRVRMTVALLDECDTPRPNCRHARIWTTADTRRITAHDALGVAVVWTLPTSRTAGLRGRRHPVGAERIKR